MNTENTRSILIDGGELVISVGTKQIHISAKTYGAYTMNKIGINNIHIQRSSDNSNFSDEKTASGDYAYSTDTYVKNDYPVSVLLPKELICTVHII